MKQTTRNTIAQLLTAAGAVLGSLAVELLGDESTPTTTETAPKATKPKKEKAAAAAPAEPAPAAPAETAQPETPAEAESTEGGKTYEELRALIKPLVEGGQGAEVKQVIAKYGASLKDIPAKHHAAFEKDLAALGY